MGEMTTKELFEKLRGEEPAEIMPEPPVENLIDTLRTYRYLAEEIDLAKNLRDTMGVLQEILEAYSNGAITGDDYEVLTHIALDAMRGRDESMR